MSLVYWRHENWICCNICFWNKIKIKILHGLYWNFSQRGMVMSKDSLNNLCISFSLLSQTDLASGIWSRWTVWRFSKRNGWNWEGIYPWVSWCQWPASTHSCGFQAFTCCKFLVTYWYLKFFLGVTFKSITQRHYYHGSLLVQLSSFVIEDVLLCYCILTAYEL